MKHKILPFIFMSLSVTGIAQFKNDNVLYKTVDPADLCSMLDKNKGYLLLDVRSVPEHNDTSSSAVYNLGHFKGARNIDIGELGSRLSEISAYKDKPVFVYCSHSQRSRRASKMLSDSGFTKVYNINGGMTSFHYRSLKDEGCLASLYETNNSYSILSFNQICLRMQKGNPPFLMDVRSDSAFRHVSMDAKMNAMGILKGTVNIPLSDIQNRRANIPKDGQEIIITDMFGNDAAVAAALLTKNGFDKVSILIEGIDRILSTDSRDLACPDMYLSPVSYKTFYVTEFGRYSRNNSNYTLLDIRSIEEFENRHKDNWRNIGHLKNAVSIPVDQLQNRLTELDKNKEVIVYGFSSGLESYRAADLLAKNGFKNVKVLVGGIFNMRWASGNVKGQEYLRDMVKDVPETNQ